MRASIEHRCVKCGKKTPSSAAACPWCRTCLLVDVEANKAVADARLVYLAAKEIDEIGRDAPGFDEFRMALAAAPGVVAPECARGTANTIVGILRKHGISTMVVPLRRPRRRLGSRSRPLTTARIKAILHRLPTSTRIMIAAVLVLLGLGFVLSRSSKVEPVAGRSPERTVLGPALSSRDLVFAGLGSSAVVQGPGFSAAGFFVEPELLVTSAVGLGLGHPSVDITKADGAHVKGRLEHIDRWLDLAVVRVPDGDGVPLELGDATLLEKGETVSVVSLSRLRAELIVSHGIVSNQVRFDMGIAFVQVDVDLQAGRGGGAILDRWGRVVAITSSMTKGGADRGLVTPVNYLTTGLKPLLIRQSPEPERQRWKELSLQASKHDQEDLRAVRASLGRPSLVSAVLMGPDAVQVDVVRHAASSPLPERAVFELVREGALLCTSSAQLNGWTAFGDTAAGMAGSRFHQWLARHRVPGQFYKSRARVSLFGCPSPDRLRGAVLVMSAADPRADRVVIGGTSVR